MCSSDISPCTGQSRSATTLHGVYMTVLLVLVAVTITMTTLVVYMCLMMRRAKSGRVPQTTTGTTHTNNMATTSDFCEPISLRNVQNINGGVYNNTHTHTHTHTVFNLVHTGLIYREPVDTLQQHPHNCQGEQMYLER